MELTKLLFNNLTVSSNNLKGSSDISMKSDNKFEDYLSNVSSKNDNCKAVSSKDGKNIENYQKDKVYSDKTSKNNDLKNQNVKEKNNDSVENDVSQNDVKNNLKTDDTKSNATDSVDEKVDVIEKKAEELKNEVAEVLGVDTEVVENILEQLGINIFQLAEPENLLKFMQQVFQAETPSDLLLVDGIKDLFVQVKEVVGEKLANLEEAFKGFDFADFDEEIAKALDKNKNVVKSTEETSSVVAEEEIVVSEEETVETVLKNETVEENESYENKNDVQTDNVSSTVEETSQQSGFAKQDFQNNNSNFKSFENSNNGNELNSVALDNVNKAFGKVIAKSESMKNVNSSDIINQIIEKFKASVVKENVSQIKITLRPEYLGDVSLKVVSENGIVSAQFLAENQKVKEIIEANFAQLKDMLNEQGVQVSALSVSIGSESSEYEQKEFEFGQSKSSKRVNDIINNSLEEVEEESVMYVDEDDVLQTSVNYTA